MTKNTKILIGVGVVGVGAYLLWKSQQKKSFANFRGTIGVEKCCGHIKVEQVSGNDVYTCCNGRDISFKSAGNPCNTCGGSGVGKGITNTGA
jgi:hypothetical protein